MLTEAVTLAVLSRPGSALCRPQVQNLVAPRLLHAVKHAWNPLSRRQSAAVASVYRDLLVYLQPMDPLLQARSCYAAPRCYAHAMV